MPSDIRPTPWRDLRRLFQRALSPAGDSWLHSSTAFRTHLLCSSPWAANLWPSMVPYSNSLTSTKPHHSFTNSSATCFAEIYIKRLSRICKARVWRGSSSIWMVYVFLETTLLPPIPNVGVGSRRYCRSCRPCVPGSLARA